MLFNNVTAPILSRFPKLTARLRLTAVVLCLAFGGAACTTTPPAAHSAALSSLREARSSRVTLERRAADYLGAASMAAPFLDAGTEETIARNIYNTASAELTVLLRSSEAGRLWNRPSTLSSSDRTYHFHLQGAGPGIWDPDYFTSFRLAGSFAEKRVRTPNKVEGVGGALVGVRSLLPRERFNFPRGISAPVTATLDFRGRDAVLALRRPARQATARVEGKVRPLAADYSAPLLYYRHVNESVAGLAAAFFGGHFKERTGVYFLQPYDPERIPLIFIHGLIATPQMWLNVVNELEADPEIRARYQCWIFGYPTGFPIAYSALRLREELAAIDQLYPRHKGYVLVSHSLGGILAQMQVATLKPADWEQTVGAPARTILARVSTNDLFRRALIFDANPRVKRIVFICTPHRGSEMANGSLEQFGMRLISLPGSLVSSVRTSLGGELSSIPGAPDRPNVVGGLSPANPTLKVLDNVSVQAPYHSIIGNRGRPGPLAQSSDGVVPYWSSHMEKAQSELIVPGPHGSCELPQTIDELKRILKLHLEKSARRSHAQPATASAASPRSPQL